MNKKLVSFVLAAALLLAAAPVVSAQQATCPQSGSWVKVDGLSGYTYTFTAPAGSLITAWCYKASTTVVTGVVNPPAQSVTVTSTVTNDNGQLQELSHASFLLITAPTSTPPVDPTVTPTTPPVDPTVTPTTDPTSTPPVDPTVTPPVDPTVTPTTDPTSTPTDQPTPITDPVTPTLPSYPTNTPGPCSQTDEYRLVVVGNGNVGVVTLELSVGGPHVDDVNSEKTSFETNLPDTVQVVRVYLNGVEVSVTTDDGLGLPTSASRCTQRVIYLPTVPVQPTPTENPVNPTGAGGDNGDDGTGGLLLIVICVALGLGAIFSRKPVVAS